MKEIKLTQGFVAIVDDEDYERLSKYKWCCHYGYAIRGVAAGVRRRTTVQMHVEIMGKIDGLELDHINGSPLNNRKKNLRHVTRSQNMQNQKAVRKNSLSKYKGVQRRRDRGTWMAIIVFKGRHYMLGCYKSERDAAWVYNVWAESLFGKYARLNVLDG